MILRWFRRPPSLSERLHRAVVEGDAARVAALLEQGADPNWCSAKRPQDGTALMEAALRGRLDLVERLLAGGADPNGDHGGGGTALMCGAQAWHDHDAIVARLLAAGADVNAADRNGRTALRCAVRRERLDGVARLLAAGAVDDTAGTALEEAALYGHVGIVRALMEAQERCAGRRSDWGAALRAAVRQGHLGATRLLLEAGADPNGADFYGRTPVMVSAAQERCDLLGCLLAFGADPLRADRDGQTAWDRARTAAVRRVLQAHQDNALLWAAADCSMDQRAAARRM